MSFKKDLNNFKIREATLDDVDVIYNFIRELAEYEKLLNEIEFSKDELKYSLFKENNFVSIIIGEYKKNPIGYALYYYNYSTFKAKAGIYLEDLYIIPEMRNRGYGRALLSYIANIVVINKFSRLEWSVLDWNSNAINLYKSIGSRSLDGWTIQRLEGQKLIDIAKNAS